MNALKEFGDYFFIGSIAGASLGAAVYLIDLIFSLGTTKGFKLISGILKCVEGGNRIDKALK